MKVFRETTYLPEYVAVDIYFNDLNDEAKATLLEAVGVSDPKEMNWDVDICPIATYEMEAQE